MILNKMKLNNINIFIYFKYLVLSLAFVAGGTSIQAELSEKDQNLEVTPSNYLLSLSDLELVSKKSIGCNAGGVYKDQEDQRWFIKVPGFSARVSHEYIVGRLLALLDPSLFAEIRLVNHHPSYVASKFLNDFVPYRSHGVETYKQLISKVKTTIAGAELYVVVRNWLGIEDENIGNVGTVPSRDGATLHLTRIDYDTAFYFETFKTSSLDFHIQGQLLLNEAAFMQSLKRIIDLSEEQIKITLEDIFDELDEVGIDFDYDKRDKLKAFLKTRKQQFSNCLAGLELSQKVINCLDLKDFDRAKQLYQNAEKSAQVALQEEWFFRNTVKQRKQYLSYVALFPEVLKSGAVLTNEVGNTILHMAAEWNELSFMKQLLQDAAFLNLVNTPNAKGWSPMHVGTYWGYTPIVNLLLSKGANPDVKANDLKSSIDLAIDRKHQDLEKLLKETSSINKSMVRSSKQEHSVITALAAQKLIAMKSQVNALCNELDSLPESIIFSQEGVAKWQMLVKSIMSLYNQSLIEGSWDHAQGLEFRAHTRNAELNAIQAKLILDEEGCDGRYIQALDYAVQAYNHRQRAAVIADALGWDDEAVHQRESAAWLKILAKKALLCGE